MKRTLSLVLLVGALNGAAYGESAVDQVPSNLLALNDIHARALEVTQAKAPYIVKTADFDSSKAAAAVSEKLSKELDAQLQARVQRDLAIAMQ